MAKLMTIEMKNIGIVLDSRPAGREAFLAMQPRLRDAANVELDFDGVKVLTPSFADEFVTPLIEKYGDHITFLHTTKNITVQKTLRFLAEDWPVKIDFQ